MHDIVIRGGTIIDGTGAAPFTGDVAIAEAASGTVGRCSGSLASSRSMTSSSQSGTSGLDCRSGG